VIHVFHLRIAGKGGASFDLVYPAQKAAADRSKFVAACTAPTGAKFSELHIDHVAQATVEVPGTNVSAKAFVFTVTFTAEIGTAPPATSTVPVAIVKTRDGWTWVMSQRMFDVCTATSSARTAATLLIRGFACSGRESTLAPIAALEDLTSMHTFECADNPRTDSTK
jgi:hypothetical protein